jgi:short-subunit dehydrogenase
MDIKKQVAVITGATKGIGKAISLGLAQMNYHLAIIGRNKEELNQVSKKIEEISGTVPLSYQLDITDTKAVNNTITDIVAKSGKIDVLVNNAGIYFDGTLSISEDDFNSMIDTNLTAQLIITKAVVPVMKKHLSGYIFNIASRSGKIGFAGSGAYSASKFGMVGLSESLYRELTPQGIKVTALCPGWVNTKMAFKAGTPLKPEQMIQPEDLMHTIKWLLSLSPGACVKEIVIDAPQSIS